MVNRSPFRSSSGDNQVTLLGQFNVRRNAGPHRGIETERGVAAVGLNMVTLTGDGAPGPRQAAPELGHCGAGRSVVSAMVKLVFHDKAMGELVSPRRSLEVPKAP